MEAPGSVLEETACAKALRLEQRSALFQEKAEQPAEAEGGRGTGGPEVSRRRSRRASKVEGGD